MVNKLEEKLQQLGTHLYSSSPKSALRIPVVAAEYSEESELLVGFKILNSCSQNLISEGFTLNFDATSPIE